MWPMHVDYSDIECRRILRSIELEAYASVVDAFRAQGSLTEERKKLLQDLCVALSIPIERHKAEMRRAANDEHLNTIAERFSGPNTAAEWSAEGRQLVPLMSRCPPQTIFTAIADAAARTQAAKNATLPLPGKTGIRRTESGAETMISRKRKKSLSDVAGPSSKIDLMEKPHLSGLFSSDGSSLVSEPKQPSVSQSSENSSVAKTDTQASSCVKSTSSETSSAATSLPNKSAPKQTELKTSTVTTFSSFDQLKSNLPSRPTSLYRTTAPPKKVSTICEDIRNAFELKTKPRPPPPISSLKPLTFITSASTSCSTSVTIGHVPLPSSAPSSNKKVFTRIELKNPIQRKQNVPSTLDLKLSPRPQIIQAPLFPKPPKFDVKQESGFFATKSPPSVSLSLNLTGSPTVKLPSSSASEVFAVPKFPPPVSKSATETKYSTISSEQTRAKPTIIKKTLPKTSFQGSECSPRPFFTSTAKSGLKSLPPVIFNVPSTLSTPAHSSTKVTESGQKESGKSVTQSTALGIGCSHLNLNTAHTQTIQYWNEGGVIRRARIVNISQPTGSCLSRAISPSAVSALGLCPNFTSTALRVTLPAGTLSTSSSMRVSTAAKPNVILVHKVQTSAAQGQEKTANAQKESSGPSTDKLASKPDRATPSSSAVSIANLKVPETNIVTNINIPVKESPEIVVSTSEDPSGERKIKIEVQASKD